MRYVVKQLRVFSYYTNDKGKVMELRKEAFPMDSIDQFMGICMKNGIPCNDQIVSTMKLKGECRYNFDPKLQFHYIFREVPIYEERKRFKKSVY